MGDCVFCAIVAGQAPAHRLLQDEHTVSFLFHVHVVPRYRADELRPMWEAEHVPDAELAAVRARTLGRGR